MKKLLSLELSNMDYLASQNENKTKLNVSSKCLSLHDKQGYLETIL